MKGFLVLGEKDDLLGFVPFDLEEDHNLLFHVRVLLPELYLLELGVLEGIR